MKAPATRAGLASVARGGTLNLAGAIATAVSSFLLTVVVARELTTEQAGAFFTVSSVFLLLLGLVRLGGRDGMVNFVARLRAGGEEQLIPGLLRIGLGPVVLVAGATAVGLWAFADPIATQLVSRGPESAATYLRVLAVFLPAAAVMDGVLGATRGYGLMRPTVVIENLFRPLCQLLGVLVAASVGTTAVVVAWSFPFVPALVAGVWWLARLVCRHEPSGVVDPSSAAPSRSAATYWRFTAPRAVSAAVQVGLQRLDVVLVAGFLGTTATALYVASSRLLVLGAFAVQAVSLAVQPVVAAHFRRHEDDAVRDIYKTSTTWLVLATWPIYVVGIMFAPTALLLFGPQYAAGHEVLVILAFATMFSTACGIVDIMLMMAGRTSWLLANVSVALALNVVLNVVLIPAFGVNGAAWAWAAAIAVNNLLPLVQLWRSLGLHPFSRGLVLAMTAVLACYVPTGLVALAVLGQAVAALVVCGVVGSLLYAALLWRRRDRLELTTLLLALPLPGSMRERIDPTWATEPAR
jgi:O-antigen/teichoic acid export membrane protein